MAHQIHIDDELYEVLVQRRSELEKQGKPASISNVIRRALGMPLIMKGGMQVREGQVRR